MSNGSGSSSSTGDSSRARGRVNGIPKKCWCGDRVVAKISNSEANPYRRYYRCAYAANLKLMNDGHVFKWVDEAMVNEIESLENQVRGLKSEVVEMRSARVVVGDDEIQRIQVNIESEVLELVGTALMESKMRMNKMLVLVIIGLLAMVVIGLLVKN